MHLQRFFGTFDFVPHTLRVADKELLNQWQNVFRFGAGDRIVLCDGAGNEVTAVFRGLTKSGAELEILERTRNAAEPERTVALYAAVLKRENFELIAQKATEAGVSEIVPLVTARTVKLALKTDRLQKIIQEAAEQSGRGIVPRLADPVAFEQAITSAAENNANIFFHLDPGAERGLVLDADVRRVGLWIGPEGGWDEGEVAAARFAKFRVASLGSLTLRAETAAIVATYLAAQGGNSHAER